MLRHLWSRIITSHICLLCLVLAYSIFLLLKTGLLLPLRISNWETRTWMQMKSSRQQKLTTFLGCRDFVTQVQWGETWDFYLNEALTILPFRGCGGRQLSTRGHRGSFSPFLERLRSFAICKEEKFKCPCGSTVNLTTWKKLWHEKGIFLHSDKHTTMTVSNNAEITDKDCCSPGACTVSVDLHTLHPQNSSSSDPCLDFFWFFLWFTPTVWKKNRTLLWPCQSWAAGKNLVKIQLSVKEDADLCQCKEW